MKAKVTPVKDSLNTAQGDAKFAPINFLWDASNSLHKVLWDSRRRGIDQHCKKPNMHKFEKFKFLQIRVKFAWELHSDLPKKQLRKSDVVGQEVVACCQ